MKHSKLIAILLALSIGAAGVVGCSNNSGDGTKSGFDRAEYTVSDGDKINAVSGGLSYKLVGNVPDGVSVSSDGTFSISNDVADSTQVVLAAVYNGKVISTAVCSLSVGEQAVDITFGNLSSYIVSGEQVAATSSPVSSISYSLKNEVGGISINSVSGKVTFTKNVTDGTAFVVVASAKGGSAEKTFYAACDGLAGVQNDTAIVEYNNTSDGDNLAIFTLDFTGNASAEEGGVLGLSIGGRTIESSGYSYDASSHALTINSKVVGALGMGENAVKIYTQKNTISATIKCAKYIVTADDLAAINASQEALSDYYVLIDDIDLTYYLSDKPEGWTPIGKYNDVTDGTATDWAFNGTFDGNGHTISGFFIDRSDDLAYNSGLFGYVTTNGYITNLGVENAEGKVNSVRSYSGGFVGANCGTITNCWAKVDVEAGTDFKTLGCFVGRNEGTIENCYSIGNVNGGSLTGSFCGVNLGEISYCYSVTDSKVVDFCGSGSVNLCAQFADADTFLRNADFSNWSGWCITYSSLPALNAIDINSGLKAIYITNTAEYVYRGEEVKIQLSGSPSDKLAGKQVTYEITEGNLSVTADGIIKTRQAQGGRCTVKATVGDISATYSFIIYEVTTGVNFDVESATVSVNDSYTLSATVLPSGANQNVNYTLVGQYYGVNLKNGVLTFDRKMSGATIEVKATSEDGNYSDTMEIIVSGNEVAEGCDLILYREDNKNASFPLPDGEAAKVTKVTVDGAEVNFTQSGNNVIVGIADLDKNDNGEVDVVMYTDKVSYYGTASVYSKEDVILIGSVEDFLNYKSDSDNLKKIAVLTADLDFEGQEITSFGNTTDMNVLEGIFNGNGHTIKNVKIVRNDYSQSEVTTVYDPATGNESYLSGDWTTNRYHSSFYNVGLFSEVDGLVCNVNFENVTVAITYDGDEAGNMAGVVCGMLLGEVKRCTFTDCKVSAAGDYKGIVTGRNMGDVEYCYQYYS